MTDQPRSQAGSILLITLVVTGLIASISLTFAATMGSRFFVARSDRAALKADLAVQSGLEYARRQLLLEPQWISSGDRSVDIGGGTAFRALRLPGQTSPYLRTEVDVVVEGHRRNGTARAEARFAVDPGDPLLSRAVSVLGERVSGSNLRVIGDVLLLDRRGWLWVPRNDLRDVVEGDPRFAAGSGDADELLRWNLVDGFYTGSSIDGEPEDGDLLDDDVSEELTEEQLREWQEHVQRLREEGYVSADQERGILDLLSGFLDRLALLAALDPNPPPDDDVHARKEGSRVTGTWAPSDEPFSSDVRLDRMDVEGTATHYDVGRLRWADRQERGRRPVHAPGWMLDGYLDDPQNVRLFEGVAEVSDLEIEKTAVFRLDPGESLELTDVVFEGGLVIWCEEDFDFQGPPRNRVTLDGSCRFGGGNRGVPDVGVIAPGAQFSVAGADSHHLSGYSILHSLYLAKRIHSDGILVILNDLVDLMDSEFVHDPRIAQTPARGLRFFGGVTDVDVLSVRELHSPAP